LWINLWYYPSSCLAGLRKTTKILSQNIGDLWAKIWTQGLLNTKQMGLPLQHSVHTHTKQLKSRLLRWSATSIKALRSTNTDLHAAALLLTYKGTRSIVTLRFGSNFAVW
jgi:hypothetical protein